MYKKRTGNYKQEEDAGNRMLCPYRNFSQAIKNYCLPFLSLDSFQLCVLTVYHKGTEDVYTQYPGTIILELLLSKQTVKLWP